MATEADVIHMAFRMMGFGTAVSGDDMAAATPIFAAQYAELGAENPVPWDTESIPEAATVALARFLAADLAPAFGMQAGSRGAAKLRCLAHVRPDTRQPAQDVDAEYY